MFENIDKLGKETIEDSIFVGCNNLEKILVTEDADITILDETYIPDGCKIEVVG